MNRFMSLVNDEQNFTNDIQTLYDDAINVISYYLPGNNKPHLFIRMPEETLEKLASIFDKISSYHFTSVENKNLLQDLKYFYPFIFQERYCRALACSLKDGKLDWNSLHRSNKFNLLRAKNIIQQIINISIRGQNVGLKYKFLLHILSMIQSALANQEEGKKYTIYRASESSYLDIQENIIMQKVADNLQILQILREKIQNKLTKVSRSILINSVQELKIYIDSNGRIFDLVEQNEGQALGVFDKNEYFPITILVDRFSEKDIPMYECLFHEKFFNNAIWEQVISKMIQEMNKIDPLEIPIHKDCFTIENFQDYIKEFSEDEIRIILATVSFIHGHRETPIKILRNIDIVPTLTPRILVNFVLALRDINYNFLVNHEKAFFYLIFKELGARLYFRYFGRCNFKDLTDYDDKVPGEAQDIIKDAVINTSNKVIELKNYKKSWKSVHNCALESLSTKKHLFIKIFKNFQEYRFKNDFQMYQNYEFMKKSFIINKENIPLLEEIEILLFRAKTESIMGNSSYQELCIKYATNVVRKKLTNLTLSNKINELIDKFAQAIESKEPPTQIIQKEKNKIDQNFLRNLLKSHWEKNKAYKLFKISVRDFLFVGDRVVPQIFLQLSRDYNGSFLSLVGSNNQLYLEKDKKYFITRSLINDNVMLMEGYLEGADIIGQVVYDTKIVDKHVSKRHAMFELQGSELLVKDLDSKNGTYKISKIPTNRKIPC
ncbi:MAG: FHA domain-containing protein [Leptospiraceae bacterium]|nr:FHA domain-containing protein [Leptospiraceae bacterium]MCP5493450.1 FHA domain-containing protein [Leptospiraceae bacterium]